MSQKKECIVPDCTEFVKAKNYCNGHYQQYSKGQELRPLRVQHSNLGNTCRFPDCGRVAVYNLLCNQHNLQRAARGESGMIPIRERRSGPDGWIVNNQGYISRSVKVNGQFRQQLQHRFVMEEIYGRPLDPGENVHHINGDRADNRPENLELWSTSQPAGQRVSDKIRWAKEILAKYGIDPTMYEGKSHK